MTVEHIEDDEATASRLRRWRISTSSLRAYTMVFAADLHLAVLPVDDGQPISIRTGCSCIRSIWRTC